MLARHSVDLATRVTAAAAAGAAAVVAASPTTKQQCVPSVTLSDAEREALTKRIQVGGSVLVCINV
jgi:hypothetical protein